MNESRIHAKFVQLLRESQINALDMRPIFEEGGQPLNYYYPEDAHWIEEGHRKVEDALPEHLTRRTNNMFS